MYGNKDTSETGTIVIPLDNVYVNNKEYIKQYNYLMNNEEYFNSEFRNKRLSMYIKTKINKEGDIND